MTRAEAAHLAAQIRTARGTVEVECPICSTRFRAQKHVLVRTKTKTCSRECRSVAMSREGNWRWRGGRYQDMAGYWHVMLPDGTYSLEHRVVMSEKLGRSLLPTEVVHHINEEVTDNRPENLKLYAEPGMHILENHASRCPTTGRFQPLKEDGQRT
jgi:HNH endonuclease